MEHMKIINPHKKYTIYGQLTYSCQYHVIFCTKYRRKVLSEPIISRLKELMSAKQKEYNYKIIDMQIVSDHVHVLISVNPKMGIYSVVTKIKGYTSSILRQEFPELVKKLPTLWTRSRFISSVGDITLDTVQKYIEQQKSV